MSLKELQSKSIIANVLWMCFGIAIAASLFLLTRMGISNGLYRFIIFGITIALFYFSKQQDTYEWLTGKIFSGIIIFLILTLFFQLVETFSRIPEWDYLCFYLFGKVGIASQELYNPAVFLRIFNELQLQDRVHENFRLEIVNVGFWYPPPSMFLFLPLGLFDLRTGYNIWQTLVIIFLMIDCFLLARNYLPDGASIKNITIKSFLVIPLILFFPDLLGTTANGQTIAFFLFLLILMIGQLDTARAGIYLACLVIIKPLAVFFALYFLLFRKWKPLIALAITGMVFVLLSILFFGFHTLLDYFISSPTGRIPPAVFSEPVNQSLQGVLLRLQQSKLSFISPPAMKMISYFLSFCLLVITCFGSKKISKFSHPLSFMIFIPLTLLIYPGTLSFYILILLPLVLCLFNLKIFKDDLINLVFIFILYGVGFYSLFLFNLVLLFVLVAWPLVLNQKIFESINSRWLSTT